MYDVYVYILVLTVYGRKQGYSYQCYSYNR